jgi:hypothetical protein
MPGWWNWGVFRKSFLPHVRRLGISGSCRPWFQKKKKGRQAPGLSRARPRTRRRRTELSLCMQGRRPSYPPPGLALRATIKTVVARLDRAIQYAAAPRSIANAAGILGRPVKPGDDTAVAVSTEISNIGGANFDCPRGIRALPLLSTPNNKRLETGGERP